MLCQSNSQLTKYHCLPQSGSLNVNDLVLYSSNTCCSAHLTWIDIKIVFRKEKSYLTKRHMGFHPWKWYFICENVSIPYVEWKFHIWTFYFIYEIHISYTNISHVKFEPISISEVKWKFSIWKYSIPYVFHKRNYRFATGCCLACLCCIKDSIYKDTFF